MGTDLPSSPLVTRPTFLDGVASLFDLAGANVQYVYSDTLAEADARAMQRDWEMLGRDLQEATQRAVHGRR
jgi:hypothetical protein